MNDPIPDPELQLSRLKDFQRRTVDFVFRRLYEDDPPALRYLVADEVGLGKTMVARGVIAKAIQKLDRQGVRRIDVIYVCSNAAIAAQNLARLDVLPRDDDGRTRRQTSFATRLTLLPLHVSGLNDNRVNFISFTPGTTFNLRSRGGVVQERALLFYILREVPGLSTDGLNRMLRDRAGWGTWGWASRLWDDPTADQPDSDIVAAMREVVRQDLDLYARLKAVVDEWVGREDEDSHERAVVNRRLAMIGELRMTLSGLCLDALEPDLIILDEFQRFKHLLDQDTDQSELAQRLFTYRSTTGEPPPRVLLLSATPYKMYTIAGEVEDNHYADLLQTLAFLYQGDGTRVQAVQDALYDYRATLTRTVATLRANGPDAAAAEQALGAARDRVQGLLHQVMVRTERTASIAHRDAMVLEAVSEAPLEAQDLHQAIAVDRVARAVGSQDIVEYWKSAPYLLSFMKGYDLKRRLDGHVQGQTGATAGSDELCDAVRAAASHMVDAALLDAYGELDAANPRLRLLLRDMFDDQLWRLLWLPPSMPYLQPGDAYARAARASKSLVFSSWNVVPDAIAAVSSYLAERQMVTAQGVPGPYSSLSKDRRGLLRYAVSRSGTSERFAGMGALLLQYPSPYLASVADPLDLARQDGGLVDPELALERVAQRIQEALDRLAVAVDPHRPGRDARWYWIAVAMLDATVHPDTLLWLFDPGERGLGSVGRRSVHSGEETGFDQVVARFVQHAGVPPEMGPPPDDLARVLAEVALGAPGVCALRALRRQVPDQPLTEPDLLHAAALVGEGFRTLFNLPETMGLLGAFDRHRSAEDDEDDQDYWRRCVQHGLEGNLQAVLDEQVHVLRESLGLVGTEHSVREIADGIAEELAESLSVRTANLFIDELQAPHNGTDRGWLQRSDKPFSFRTRFGLRLGELRDENKQVHRIDVVRKAFNSPFRPFLLASTSVGQEGLDFHTWCHVVYHWNLPGNPVDMEQREGRVHRYKGLAVRRNIAASYRAAVLDGRWDGHGDPWSWMFEQARSQRDAQLDDLVPYWLYDQVPDGRPARVERRVPIVPLSREASRYQALKRSLVYYRLAFGQPRQDDLVSWLQQQLGDDAASLVEGWRIDLRAPVSSFPLTSKDSP